MTTICATVLLVASSYATSNETVKAPAAGKEGVIIITHTIADFPKWKAVFDSDQSVRLKNDIRFTHIYRDITNPNKITIILEAKDLEKSKSYFESPKLVEKMKTSGVVDKPVVSYLTEEK